MIRRTLGSIFSLTLLLAVAGCEKPGASAMESTPKEKGAVAASPTPAKPAPQPTQAPRADLAPAGNWVAVKRGSVQEVIPATASFKARQTTRLGSQVAGRVETVAVEIGDKVKKGQEIAQLDSSFFRITRDEKQAQLESNKVMVEDTKRKLDRAKELWGSGQAAPISRQQLDDAQTLYDMARSKVRETEQSLRYAEQQLKETVIRAPYDAIVTQRLVDPGEPVQAMFITPLLEVQQIDVLELHFSLPQETFSRVKEGMPVVFRAEGIEDLTGEGVLDNIYPANDEATRSFHCRVFVKNPDLKLRPGLLAQAGVVRREAKDVLTVPRGALTQTSSGWRVTVQVDGRATEREIKVGLLSFLDNAEVKEGLKEGDLVLVPERKQ